MVAELKEAEIDQEVADNANKDFIDIADYTVSDAVDTTPESEPTPEPSAVNEEAPY